MFQIKRLPIYRTKQAVFNRVWRFFFIQKHPRCLDDYGTCDYRSEESACAIGCLIPDKYTLAPGTLAEEEHLDDNAPVIRKRIKNVKWEFLRELQYIHDTQDEKKMKESLAELAKRHKLKIPNA